ncbi:MAG: purine-binding chemotaxis protein CheW [Deltaproteobacteria bacterium]|nr:purine-binding chemotaxis protein CheW [Deltaproteobacteria bacterium]
MGDANDKRTADSSTELLQLVTFVVGGEEYAVPILSVHEINRMMEITRVPQAPEFLDGVINLRGKIIPVVDLRTRFGLSRQDRGSDNRIVVVEVRGRVIGFTVDRVNEVLRISSSIVDEAPTIGGIEADYVRGVGKLEDRLLIMLDLEALFGETELERLEDTAAAA